MLEFDPGEAAQVDFGKGPDLLDPRTGAIRPSWVFIMTLAWSRHAYVEFVTDQKVATWLGCHRRAFEWFAPLGVRIPAKPITHSGLKAVTDSGQADHPSERSDAGGGL